MKRLRVLVLMHESLIPPDSLQGHTDAEILEWKTEFDVVTTLRELGHEVLPLGVYDDLGDLRRATEDFKPHVWFNLLEEFHGVGVYDHHVVSYLELMKQQYTGCNPRGLLLAHDKPLAKKILSFHQIRTPSFFVAPRGKKRASSPRLSFLCWSSPLQKMHRLESPKPASSTIRIICKNESTSFIAKPKPMRWLKLSFKAGSYTSG